MKVLAMGKRAGHGCGILRHPVKFELRFNSVEHLQVLNHHSSSFWKAQRWKKPFNALTRFLVLESFPCETRHSRIKEETDTMILHLAVREKIFSSEEKKSLAVRRKGFCKSNGFWKRICSYNMPVCSGPSP